MPIIPEVLDRVLKEYEKPYTYQRSEKWLLNNDISFGISSILASIVKF